MHLDPDDYDPHELRRIARDVSGLRNGDPSRFEDRGPFRFDNPLYDTGHGSASEALRSSQLEQLLVHQSGHDTDHTIQKPYLRSLPDKYGAERVVFDWLEFLVLKGGFKRAMDALRYYQSVDWLTADVEETLRNYLLGFSGDVEDADELDVDDHLLSLVYIARLASMV